MGSIDKRSITALMAFVQTQEFFKLSSRELTFYQFCARMLPTAPKFLWLLRDFHLPLNSDTPRDYLENVLAMESPSDTFTQVKEMMINLFPSRDCIVLPRPEHTMDTEFITAVEAVETEITNCGVKQFGGVALTGPTLADLIENAVAALASGEPIALREIERTLGSQEYTKTLAVLEEKYEKLLHLEIMDMPYSEIDIALKLQKAKTQARSEVQTSHLTDPQQLSELWDEFDRFTLDTEHFVTDANLAASEAFNSRLLNSLFSPLLETETLDTHWADAARRYETEALGPMKLKAISEFLKEHPIPSDMEAHKGIITDLERQKQESMDQEKQLIAEIAQTRVRLRTNKSRKSMQKFLETVGTKLEVPKPSSGDDEVYLENIILKLRTKDGPDPQNPVLEPVPKENPVPETTPVPEEKPVPETAQVPNPENRPKSTACCSII